MKEFNVFPLSFSLIKNFSVGLMEFKKESNKIFKQDIKQALCIKYFFNT